MLSCSMKVAKAVTNIDRDTADIRYSHIQFLRFKYGFHSTAGGPTTAIHVSIDHTEQKEQVPGISFKPQ